MWGCLNAGVAHVHKRCMSDDCSRQHGKYKIGQLLKMHCAERAFGEVCLEKEKKQIAGILSITICCGFLLMRSGNYSCSYS